MTRKAKPGSSRMKPPDELSSGSSTAIDGSVMFQLAAFAKDQSGADGVISIFVKGPTAQIAYNLPPALLGRMPEMLHTAAHASVEQLVAIAEKIGGAALGDVPIDVHMSELKPESFDTHGCPNFCRLFSCANWKRN